MYCFLLIIYSVAQQLQVFHLGQVLSPYPLSTPVCGRQKPGLLVVNFFPFTPLGVYIHDSLKPQEFLEGGLGASKSGKRGPHQTPCPYFSERYPPRVCFIYWASVILKY